MGLDAMIFIFWMLNFKPTFSFSFTFNKRLFSFSLLLAKRVVLSVYLRLLVFLSAILTPACASSSLAFHVMYSAYKLNKQDDNIQPWHTSCPNLEPVHCPMSGSNWFFLTCIQISQKTGKVDWCCHCCENFPVCCDPDKDFILVNEAEVLSGILVLILWYNTYWQFDLWFLCLF